MILGVPENLNSKPLFGLLSYKELLAELTYLIWSTNIQQLKKREIKPLSTCCLNCNMEPMSRHGSLTRSGVMPTNTLKHINRKSRIEMVGNFVSRRSRMINQIQSCGLHAEVDLISCLINNLICCQLFEMDLFSKSVSRLILYCFPSVKNMNFTTRTNKIWFRS